MRKAMDRKAWKTIGRDLYSALYPALDKKKKKKYERVRVCVRACVYAYLIKQKLIVILSDINQAKKKCKIQNCLLVKMQKRIYLIFYLTL